MRIALDYLIELFRYGNTIFLQNYQFLVMSLLPSFCRRFFEVDWTADNLYRFTEWSNRQSSSITLKSVPNTTVVIPILRNNVSK
jgi:hypothetical protein